MLLRALNTLLADLAGGEGWRWGSLVGLSERRRLFHRALIEARSLPTDAVAQPLAEIWELLGSPRLAAHLAAHCHLVLGDGTLADRLVVNAQGLVATWWAARSCGGGETAAADDWAGIAARLLDGANELDDPAAPRASTAEVWTSWWAAGGGPDRVPATDPVLLPVAGYQDQLGSLLFRLWMWPLPAGTGIVEHPEMALMPLGDDLIGSLQEAGGRLPAGCCWRLEPLSETEVEVLRGASLSGAAHLACLALRLGKTPDPGCLVLARVHGDELVETEQTAPKLGAAAADASITRVILPGDGTGPAALDRSPRGRPVISHAPTLVEALELAITPPPERGQAVTARRAVLAALGLGALALPTWLGRRSEDAIGYYELVDLGTLGGPTSAAAQINNVGWITGCSHNGQCDEAYLWRPDTGLQGLGTLGGRSDGVDLNDAGWVCGCCGDDSANLTACVWRPGRPPQALGRLRGGDYSSAHGINNGGWVVGRARDAVHAEAFLWRAEHGMVGLGPGLGYSAAEKVNDHGVVVARTSPTSFQDWQPRRWTLTGGYEALPDDGGDASASGINGAGQVVGVSHTGQRRAAVVWQPDGRRTVLGSLYDLPSFGNDINDRGVVVGTIENHCGFVWSPDAGMHDLNRLLRPEDAGYLIFAATAINNRGEIATIVYNPQREQRAALLRPVRPLPRQTANRPRGRPAGFASATNAVDEWTVRALGDAWFGPQPSDRYASAVVRFETAAGEVDHRALPAGTSVTVHGCRLLVVIVDDQSEDNRGYLEVSVGSTTVGLSPRRLDASACVVTAETRGVGFGPETQRVGKWRVGLGGTAWCDAWHRRRYCSAVVQFQTAGGARDYAVVPVGGTRDVVGRDLRVILVDDAPRAGRGELDATVATGEAGPRRRWTKRITERPQGDPLVG